MNQNNKQDVTVVVNRLNIENRTEADNIAEKAIIEAMTNREVRVVVIHKPTNDFAQFKCKLPEVRAKASEVIKKHSEKLFTNIIKDEVKPTDYIIMEVEAEDIRVTHL